MKIFALKCLQTIHRSLAVETANCNIYGTPSAGSRDIVVGSDTMLQTGRSRVRIPPALLGPGDD
jgi:hypothetical protein